MSFEIELDPNEEAGARLVAEVGGQLQELFVHRRTHDSVTQQDVADRLGVDRSRVNRCLSGFNNLTLSSLGEIANAMDGVVLHHVIPKEQTAEWRLVRVSPAGAQNTTIYGVFGDRPRIQNIGVRPDTDLDDGRLISTADTTSGTTQVKRDLKWAK
jgi:transcriptional regulator with XRE-family HTH domain